MGNTVPTFYPKDCSTFLPGIDGHISCTHTQGGHIFIHVEQMERFSQLTRFIMIETFMVIYLGYCCYKRPQGERFTAEIYMESVRQNQETIVSTV